MSDTKDGAVSVTTITDTNMNEFQFISSYRINTTSNGCTGKKNIEIVYDKVTPMVVMALADGEIKRKVNALARESDGLVERIKSATQEKPVVFKVSELSSGTVMRVAVDPMIQLKNDLASGARTKEGIQAELAELLAALDE